jgi:hypothetical protein
MHMQACGPNIMNMEEPRFLMRYLDEIEISRVTTLSHINSFAQQNHFPFCVKTT